MLKEPRLNQAVRSLQIELNQLYWEPALRENERDDDEGALAFLYFQDLDVGIDNLEDQLSDTVQQFCEAVRSNDSGYQYTTARSRDFIALTERLHPQENREAGIDNAYELADRLLADLPKHFHWIIVTARIGFVTRISMGLWLNVLSEAIRRLFRAV